MGNVLIADIGGTNARFALASDTNEHMAEMQRIDCDEFESAMLAIEYYLEKQNIKDVDAICFAVAGPVIDQTASFTNNHWEISRTDLVAKYRTKAVRILNDFESIAYSLPVLTEKDISAVGGDWALPSSQEFSVGVLGPGTGLGVAGLYARDGKHYPVVAEGGHTGFSPENPEQIRLLKSLSSKFGRVSNERLLSGPGIINIYQALAEINNADPGEFSAAEIATKGTSRQDELCKNTMDLFFEILGQVTGDLALTLGTHDGIFIAGGICQRYGQALTESRFRHGFSNKGRHSHLLENIPTWLISHPNAGLVGASNYARHHLSK